MAERLNLHLTPEAKQAILDIAEVASMTIGRVVEEIISEYHSAFLKRKIREIQGYIEKEKP